MDLEWCEYYEKKINKINNKGREVICIEMKKNEEVNKEVFNKRDIKYNIFKYTLSYKRKYEYTYMK